MTARRPLGDQTDGSTPPPRPSGPSTFHWALAALAVAWMQVGPVAVQVLDGEAPFGAMAWRMYSTRADDVCGVRWWVVEPDGELRALATAHGSVGQPPHGRPTRLRSRKEITVEARKRCRSSKQEVRADAWCGDSEARGQWRQVLISADNLCAGEP